MVVVMCSGDGGGVGGGAGDCGGGVCGGGVCGVADPGGGKALTLSRTVKPEQFWVQFWDRREKCAPTIQA
jgi:hypothetical protein